MLRLTPANCLAASTARKAEPSFGPSVEAFSASAWALPSGVFGSASSSCRLGQRPGADRGRAARRTRQHADHLAEARDEGPAGRLAAQQGIDLGRQTRLEITPFAIVHFILLPLDVPAAFAAAGLTRFSFPGRRTPRPGSSSRTGIRDVRPGPASLLSSPKRRPKPASRFFHVSVASTARLTTPRGSRPCCTSSTALTSAAPLPAKHWSVQHSACGARMTLSSVEDRIVGLRRLLLEHVEPGAGDAPLLQRLASAPSGRRSARARC